VPSRSALPVGLHTRCLQVDLWSVGVIVYILLCGFPPFYGDNDAQMFKRIKAGQYKFLSPYWDPISADAKDFVKNLLIVDPRKRMTAAEALNHRWLGRTSSVSSKNLFAGKDGKGEAEAPRSPVGPRPGSAGSVDAEPAGMRVQMIQHNIDRKVAAPAKLIKAFDLPADAQRIGKYSCSLSTAFGQLHVTTGHLCFVGSFGKRVSMALGDVVELKPAKRFSLSPGHGHSLHVKSKAGQTMVLHGISERDACLELIKSQCAVAGSNPVVTKA